MSRDKHSQRCIDGRIVGRNKCVGYCEYDGHRGFLTQELRKEHNCIKKGCVFYVSQKPTRKVAEKADEPSLQPLVDIANEKSARFEAMRFLKAKRNDDGNCILFYVAIAEYPLDELIEELEEEIGAVRFERLNYDFEKCEKLIFP